MLIPSQLCVASATSMSISEIKVEEEIRALLLRVAELKKIKNCETVVHVSGIRGEGFLGEFFLGAVVDMDTNEKTKVAVKKALKTQHSRMELNIHEIYKNEALFYAEVYPVFEKMQKEYRVERPFDHVALYYCSTLEEPEEALVMENLKSIGFNIRAKELLLDDEHARMIFDLYGRFHALSFALKDQNVEKYRKLGAKMYDFTKNIFKGDGFKTLVNGIGKQALGLLEDGAIRKATEKYLSDPAKWFAEVMNYDGEFDVFNHGDAWSSNNMFRYTENGKLRDMRLIDFQLIRRGTPVYDLSYFFYTGGNKELFDKLDDYLKIYHESLSKNIRELGSDPEELYPFKQLKAEWKKYALFGVIFSLLLVKLKLLEKKDVESIVDDEKDNKENEHVFLNANVNEDLFRIRSRDILENACKEGIMS